MMNTLLTTIWLIFGTLCGYWFGDYISDESVIVFVCAVVGFILALIIRFAPKVFGELLDGLGNVFD